MSEEQAELVYHPPSPKKYAGIRVKLGSRSRKLPCHLEPDELLVVREPGKPPLYAVYVVDDRLYSVSIL